MIARLAVACLAAMTLATFTATAQEPVSDKEAIQDLVDRRAEAIRDRNRQQFLATVDKDSAQFFDEQARLFESLGSVPLKSYELHVRWDRYGDLVRPGDRARYSGAEEVAIPVTEEVYQIEGFDRRPAVEDMFFTFVKRDGEWRIGEDSDLNDLAFYSGRHLWDYGSLYRVDGEHFVVFGHKCTGETTANLCPAEARSFIELAEKALQRVDRYWTRPWSRRVVVMVPATAEELKRILQITFDPSDFVAFAYATVTSDDGIEYGGNRIIFNWRSLSDRSDADVTTILAHELVHVASRDISGPFVPVFVDEGLAEYIGHDTDPGALDYLNAEISAGIFDARLPEDFEFITGDGTSIFRSYQEGQSLIRFFAERYGMNDLFRFYRALGTPLAPGTARYHMDRALRQVTGIDLADLERAWADSIS